MIWNHRDQLRVFISRILRCWTRELHLLWTTSSRIIISRKRSVWEIRKPKKRIGFFEKDGSLTWSSTILESLVLTTHFLIMLIYSQSLFATTTSNIWYEMEWNSIIGERDPTGWCSGKFVQIENMWVWTTQNRSGIVWYGEFIRRYRGLIIRSWKRWWREVKVRKFDYEKLMPEMRELRMTQLLRAAGD